MLRKRPDTYQTQGSLKCCHTCEYSMFHYDGVVECQKHECSVSNIGICDDFEHRKGVKTLKYDESDTYDRHKMQALQQ